MTAHPSEHPSGHPAEDSLGQADQEAAFSAAPWLARAYMEIHRRRHLILYGNVEDRILWDNDHVPFRHAVRALLVTAGFLAVGEYDLVDGLTFPDPRSEQLLRRHLGGRADPAAQDVPDPPRGSRAGGSVDRLRRRVQNAQDVRVRAPAEMLAVALPMLTQHEAATALVMHAADLVIGTGLPAGDEYRSHLAHLRRLFAEAAMATAVTGEELHNTVILVCHDIVTLPEALCHRNPHVAAVQVGLPDSAERVNYLVKTLPRFHGGDTLAPEVLHGVAATIGNLTEGMSITEIDALRATSLTARLPVSSAKELIVRHRFGLREDPWERLDQDKVAGAEKILGARVIGQPAAVRAVADVLCNARVGIGFTDEDSPATRPTGVFFFVGPTGVGKTELAKALASLVFDDEAALRRFDMSEFSQEHASERLTGAPPGYVGHEQGGVLTNWVRERPFSVILFDEIEKANPKIFDKFLQIIDDGRLTDGQGRTAYFSHSIVIFTSNVGAGDLRPGIVGPAPAAQPSYQQVEAHFREAVETYLTRELRRPELLGRLGNGVVVFDILRPEMIGEIVDKFLDQLADSARRKGFDVVFQRGLIKREVVAAVMKDGAVLGARQIRSPLLERWVRTPLTRWIIDNAPEPGTRLWVHGDASAPPFTVHPVVE
ncbi:ClpB protein [[Actinomadura] parvosata subsp. kistnae]|uniref:AAA+ ATPase domain-containing protein n=1 Tax=[Actinomadura] parvosata subsp. kistnae TaxID=1909395 RepID=A0A1U9ZY23_9ACTN|nr:AAA family ATPase [Nonomuraea sp. ATCC 55076]AQZ62861.1 hypothetical protein BKM31_16595 [Nonomuraea sp. ATCC 55076]SPL98408.1 ClpB protein [Actinomadura parvosata subsp. kistnae]